MWVEHVDYERPSRVCVKSVATYSGAAPEWRCEKLRYMTRTKSEPINWAATAAANGERLGIPFAPNRVRLTGDTERVRNGRKGTISVLEHPTWHANATERYRLGLDCNDNPPLGSHTYGTQSERGAGGGRLRQSLTCALSD